jgi:hypothetical protein
MALLQEEDCVDRERLDAGGESGQKEQDAGDGMQVIFMGRT